MPAGHDGGSRQNTGKSLAMGAFNAWLSVLEWCGKSRWYGRYRENWGQAATDWMWPTAAGVSGSLNGGFDFLAAQTAASMAEEQQASVPI
jgi:hypothetical protein